MHRGFIGLRWPRLAAALLACTTFLPASPAQDEEDVYEEGGRFRRFRIPGAESLTPEQREQLEALESIGYLTGSAEARSAGGVLRHDETRAFQGLNFFTSGHFPGAVLMDMAGNVLHTWELSFREIWPNAEVEKDHRGIPYWRRAHLFPNGDVIAIFEGLGIIKVDKDSKLVWARLNNAHHDFDIAPNGDIYLLTFKYRIIPELDPKAYMREDFLTVLGPDGAPKREISLYQALADAGHADLIKRRRYETGDLFHTNAVEILDGRIADRVPAFARGRVLASMCFLNAIAVIDLDTRKAVWVHEGDYKLQHDPMILENGNLLLFDNRGRAEASRVFEFDPATMAPVWVYGEAPDEHFYSQTCGTSRRLPNGNTLIVESDNGRAFEVTPQKQIVWEYVNPHRAGPENAFIATIFDLIRIPPGYLTMRAN